MDYEKKYKEALVNMQELYNSMKYMSSTDALHTTTALESAFPELKESEDERIRKEIIRLLHKGGYMSPEDKEKAFAWLEKQGEQKSQRMISAEAKEALYGKPAWSEDDEIEFNHILKTLTSVAKEQEIKGYNNLISSINWFKSLKDRVQPQWKPSDEQMKGIDCAIKTLRHQLNVEDKRLNSLYNDLKKL